MATGYRITELPPYVGTRIQSIDVLPIVYINAATGSTETQYATGEQIKQFVVQNLPQTSSNKLVVPIQHTYNGITEQSYFITNIYNSRHLIAQLHTVEEVLGETQNIVSLINISITEDFIAVTFGKNAPAGNYEIILIG